jgi:hypothetical protein
VWDGGLVVSAALLALAALFNIRGLLTAARHGTPHPRAL